MDRDYFPVELSDKEQMKRYRLIGKYAMEVARVLKQDEMLAMSS